MDRGEMRELLEEILTNNEDQIDQDFSEKRLNNALWRAYVREVGMAKQEGQQEYFRGFQEITWPAGDSTLILPSNVSQKYLMRMDDINDGEPGHQLQVSYNGLTGDVRWLNRNTLQWVAPAESSGPTQDRTIRVTYYISPVKMNDDLDEYDLITEPWQELVAWSAACQLRKMADEAAPGQWLYERDELRRGYWKDVARGRPVDQVPWIKPHESSLSTDLNYS